MRCEPFLYRWFVNSCRKPMSLWPIAGINGRIRIGAFTTTTAAEVGAPHIVFGLRVGAAEAFAPGDVIGGVHGAL
jgi:hypothetical protein